MESKTGLLLAIFLFICINVGFGLDKSELLGTWTSQIDNFQVEFVFNSDDTFVCTSINDNGPYCEIGTFSISDGVLTITTPTTGEQRFSVSISNNLLVFEVNGKQYAFTRGE